MSAGLPLSRQAERYCSRMVAVLAWTVAGHFCTITSSAAGAQLGGPVYSVLHSSLHSSSVSVCSSYVIGLISRSSVNYNRQQIASLGALCDLLQAPVQEG